jgi:hypothetical protein
MTDVPQDQLKAVFDALHKLNLEKARQAKLTIAHLRQALKSLGAKALDPQQAQAKKSLEAIIQALEQKTKAPAKGHVPAQAKAQPEKLKLPPPSKSRGLQR